MLKLEILREMALNAVEVIIFYGEEDEKYLMTCIFIWSNSSLEMISSTNEDCLYFFETSDAAKKAAQDLAKYLQLNTNVQSHVIGPFSNIIKYLFDD